MYIWIKSSMVVKSFSENNNNIFSHVWRTWIQIHLFLTNFQKVFSLWQLHYAHTMNSDSLFWCCQIMKDIRGKQKLLEFWHHWNEDIPLQIYFGLPASVIDSIVHLWRICHPGLRFVLLNLALGLYIFCGQKKPHHPRPVT